MIKKLLLSTLTTLAFSTTTLSAYDLKSNMLLLEAELSEIQRTFIISDMNGVNKSVQRFAKHSEELLGNKKNFEDMLPKDKKHKAQEAVMAAQIIKHNVNIILSEIENKHNHSDTIRREEAQRAYTYIEHACFRCHNIVRDK